MGKWRSSAAYRIAFINFAAYSVGLALLGVIVFAAMHIAFSRQLDATVSAEAHSLQNEYSRGGDAELAKEIAEREAPSSSTTMLYAVFAPDGRRLYGSLLASRPKIGLHPIRFWDPEEGPDEARAISIDLSAKERLVVAIDDDWLDEIEKLIVVIFSLAFAGSIVVGFGGALVLGSYLQRRIQSIISSAEAIVRGDIRRRMPVGPRGDEFDQLASTLNRMLDQIEGLLENLRQVSTDLAHDLRTPLARLRNSLERGTIGSGEPEEVVADAIGQLDQVLSLFAAILRVAEVESGETKRFFGPVDLTAMLTDLAESYAPAFEDNGRTLLWSIEPDLEVDGDRELLAQAMINLLENAQRHTPCDAIVRMSATRDAKTVFMQVADNGPGVPKGDLDRVTKRFARLETSRNTPGHGLGLSLVTAVAKLHGGRLELRQLAKGL
ncbi:MAG TPA: HAMP domain-containing sensor histidine kinase, partial [Sphingomicrobium sp.]|nr:HAMP domain-containing sensor histidine kinase [Sphingomicrobium sp.]